MIYDFFVIVGIFIFTEMFHADDVDDEDDEDEVVAVVEVVDGTRTNKLHCPWIQAIFRFKWDFFKRKIRQYKSIHGCPFTTASVNMR